MINLTLYAFAWFLFGAAHSLLARHAVQQRFEPFFGRGYRLLYNLFAVVKILAVLFFGKYLLSESRFDFLSHQLIDFASFGIQALGGIVLVVAFASYDIGRFIGITQLFTGERVSVVSSEALQRNGLNRWVRHPLYTGAFLVLWGGAINSFELWTAIWGTVYLVIGTLFEERKLIRIYGDDYRHYQQQVPRYFPN